MTVSYAPLGKKKTQSGAEWIVLKCFYGEEQSLRYGEFYLCINLKEHLIKFESKEGYYDAVLTQAFHDAMRKG
jgi:hypothetical protein